MTRGRPRPSVSERKGMCTCAQRCFVTVRNVQQAFKLLSHRIVYIVKYLGRAKIGTVTFYSTCLVNGFFFLITDVTSDLILVWRKGGPAAGDSTGVASKPDHPGKSSPSCARGHAEVLQYCSVSFVPQEVLLDMKETHLTCTDMSSSLVSRCSTSLP